MGTDLLRGFRLGGLIVEPLTGKVTSRAGLRHVQPKAMQVLVCLAENPGDLVTRERLLEDVWGDPSANASILSHAVSELRSALDDHSDDPQFIQTIPRRGYRLLVEPTLSSDAAIEAEAPAIELPTSSVWKALMKHGVVQAAVAFLIFGWLIIQVADATFEIVGFPDWSTKFVTYVVISGFPIVVALAWFLEAAGGRLFLDRGAQTGRFFQALERNYLAIVAAYGMAFVGVAVYHYTLGLQGPTVSADSTAAMESSELEVLPNSIAVLRFLNIDGSERTTIFSDGLSEDVLDRVAMVPGLLVSSRGDAWSLPPNAPSALVRQRLRVAHFVEGSVRSDGDTLRIVVQLIESERGIHVISRSFERPLADFMGLQREITSLIVANLRIALPEDSLSMLVADTAAADVDAYVLYRRGVDLLHQPDSQVTLQQAIGFFEQALEVDSGYPAAHAGLCRAYVQSFVLGSDTRFIEPAEGACSAALAVNSKLDMVYVALGDLYRRTGRRDDCVTAYERALENNPQSVPALRGLAYAYEHRGRLDEAESMLTEAIRLQPGNWQSLNALGGFLFAQGRYEEAAGAYGAILDLDPDNWQGLGNLGGALLMTGDFENAATALQRSIEFEPDLSNLTNLATIYYYLGRFDESVAIHRESVASFPTHEVGWMNLADSLLFSSDADEATDAYRMAAELSEKKLELDPENTRTLCRAAWAETMLGDTAKAEQFMQRALQLAPNKPYVHYYDALLRTRSGDFDAALDALSVALANGYPRAMLLAEPLLADLHDEGRYLTLINRQPNEFRHQEG